MNTVTELFGSMVFNDSVMRARLPKDVFKQVQRSIQDGKRLDSSAATVVANAMKDWAIEKGATHFTHWFQPMTGITAEKHDSFISPVEGGKVIMEFSGKELIQGEPDASSFPSGGLRATFEARGYTAWDPTSYAFIKDNVLCIPTAFCSYGGEALDKKTPLLRSMEAINRQGMRVIKLFGNDDVTSIRTTVGPEQEYFLIDKSVYEKRKDLMYTGRTLFGAKPPKGQELDDHYFGSIRPRVAAYMQDLDEELWKLGVLSKTKHNEVAPSQHEMAPIYTDANAANDQNQLTMEIMKKVAEKHGLICLLHEKPFAGVNGSGKHNNWSLATDAGDNLFSPGSTPSQNARFLLFLAAFIKGVDEYQELLRCSVAFAGNDHRLGAQEAPPAIISVFLGEELEAIVDSIVNDHDYTDRKRKSLRIGVDVLPAIPKDTTDRNRTSPVAFTGNKFEFRSLGSSQSIAGPNTILNTIMAEELEQFAEELEGVKDFSSALHELIKRVFTEHQRILFSGNGYDESWIAEAERRGLANLHNTAEALPAYILPKNIQLMTSHGVYSKSEMMARHEIHMEKYCKVIGIEAGTLVDMVQHSILGAASAYADKLCQSLAHKKAAGVACRTETALAGTVSTLCDELMDRTLALKTALQSEPNAPQEELVRYYHDVVFNAMSRVRDIVDQLEQLVDKSYWPFPNYTDLLFSV